MMRAAIGLKRRINSFCEKYLNIRIERARKNAELSLSKDGVDNLYIAFVGPSGVGKTTISRYFKMNSAHRKKRDIILSDFLRSHANKCRDLITGIHRQLFSHYVEYSHRRLEKNLKVIRMDHLIRNYPSDKIFVLDRGHIFYKSLLPKTLFFLKSRDEKAEFLSNRIVVEIEGDVNTIIERIMYRKRTMRRFEKKHEKAFDNGTLQEWVQSERKELQDGVRKLEEMGLPVLRIKAKDDLSVNVKRIDSFIFSYNETRKKKASKKLLTAK